MKSLVIYTHPYEKSFNAAILDKVLSCEEEPDLIDLYRDGFNPVMSREDLGLYNQGGSSDPLVRNYQSRIAAVGRLIFIFPVWWYDAPAMLRGFFDKVLLRDFAFDDRDGFRGLLEKDVVLITTSGDRTLGIQEPLKSLFIEHLFKSIGIKKVTWMNCETVQDDPAGREQFLAKITGELML